MFIYLKKIRYIRGSQWFVEKSCSQRSEMIKTLPQKPGGTWVQSTWLVGCIRLWLSALPRRHCDDVSPSVNVASDVLLFYDDVMRDLWAVKSLKRRVGMPMIWWFQWFNWWALHQLREVVIGESFENAICHLMCPDSSSRKIGRLHCLLHENNKCQSRISSYVKLFLKEKT